MATNGHDPKITPPDSHHSALVRTSEEAEASWAIGLARSRTSSTRDNEGKTPDPPVHGGGARRLLAVGVG